MAKLDKVIETVLQESVVEDAAELVGIEKEDAADRISGLSFANYLELGNAVEMEDVETAKEILGTVSPIEEDRYDEEKLLDKPTPTLKDLAKKHDMSLGDIGAQLAMGIKAEKEHTSDMLVAKEIALDHLNELPDYYTKLEKMEEDIVGGADTTRSKKLVKLLDKNARRWASGIAKNARKWDLEQTQDWWLNQISSEVLDNDYFAKLHWDHPDAWHEQIEAWNRMPEYYANFIWTELLNRKKFQHYRAEITEADNPYAAPKASAPPTAVPPSAAASSIDALAQPNATSNDVDNEENQRKEVDDLSIGDDIEVIDISGDPTAVTVKNPRGPGETLIVQTDKGEEHMIKKLAVSGTPTLEALAENFDKELEEMRVGDFDDSIRKTPLYVALFKVRKVPAWASDDVAQGDLLYWNNRRDSLITVEGGRAIGLTASAVSFVGHYKFSDVLDGNFGTIKEDNIEEAEINEDYYDSEGEGASLAQELGTYGWIIYISWSRDDLDYALYKNTDKDNNRGDYRFLKVDKATGSWQTQRGKRNNEMATESGDAAELMHVIKAIEASETVEEGQNANKTEHSGAKKGKGGYHGRKKDAKSDSNKKRRANDKDAVNESDSFFFFIDPDNRGGATVMSSNGDMHDYYDNTEEAMQEVRRLNAEFGKDQDGQAIGVEEGKWDYKQRDKGKGAGTDSPMYDGGAKNRKSRKAFRKAEKAKAHQARMSGEVDESVLSDHVKVKYTDTLGRFIVVTAGAAGYWAVGQGHPYEKGIEPLSYNNLDDAVNQADADANDLDALKEMKRMAGIVTEGIFGIYRKSKAQMDSDDGHTVARSAMVKRSGSHVTFKNKKQAYKWVEDNSKGEDMFVRKVSKSVNETSSGGATGAGAIASAPAAMNGIQSRNQSIYGKTNKKPKPKQRAKESTEDGIGRNKK